MTGKTAAELYKHEDVVHNGALKDTQTVKLARGIWYTRLNFHAEFERIKG